MKLLVLEPDPSHGGGSEAVILSLSRELSMRGHEVCLLHDAHGSMLPDYREFIAEEVEDRLPGFSFRAPLRTLACVARIAGHARRLGVGAIVSSHLGFIRHCALVRAMTGIPACFHLGLPLTGPSLSWRLALGRVGHGIAPSRHTLQSWQAGGWPAEALHVVRNWIDASRFLPVADVGALRRELHLPVDGRILMFVGRVCEQKGVDVLIRAFARLAVSDVGVTLVVVGRIAAEYAATLRATLDSLDPDARARIILRPATSTPEKYYAAADLACAPSIGDEAFGLTVLEAMACGVPVVTSPIGIIPDIVGDQDVGLLAPPGDARELADRLQHWLADPVACRAAGSRLRGRVLQHYGPAQSIDQYEHIIGTLCRV